MRSPTHTALAFAFGIALGLGLASVAIRTMSRIPVRAPRPRGGTTEIATFIDGVHPPNAAELGAHPQEEQCSTVRLESEADDFSPVRERW